MINTISGNHSSNSKRFSGIKKVATMAIAGLILSCSSVERGESVQAQSGDSIFRLLKNNNIIPNEDNIKLFVELNELDGTTIVAGKEYALPKVDSSQMITSSSQVSSSSETQQQIASFNFHERIKTIEVVDNKLKGQTFIIDPGHGGVDGGAHGEIKSRNGKVEVWESEIAYDVALRLCKELRSHGADVYITRYNTKIGIVGGTLPNSDVYATSHGGNRKKDVDGMNSKDNLFINDIPGDEELSQKKRLAKRVAISNKASKNKSSTTYIAIHLDAGDTFSILYGDKKGKEFAESLVDNGFVWSVKNPEGKKVTAKIPQIKKRSLQVLRKNDADQEVLVELCDITKDESWTVRGEDNRQGWVNNLTAALIKHFN